MASSLWRRNQPAGELLAGGGADQPNQGGLADANGNMTVDFGFVPGVAIGNIVWGDTDNSGTLNGSELGIDGVTVELWSLVPTA